VIPPYPRRAFTDEALVSVAELLHEYHHAVAGFDPTRHTWPASPPQSFAGQLVNHNDPNLDNVVFRDRRAVALIDFDLASPGSRLWDVACAGGVRRGVHRTTNTAARCRLTVLG
jgi:Ser/Thr protein kinase RdoA (MazF antagonist)